jgi:hypothetical protein
MRPIFGKLILVVAIGLVGCSENLGGQRDGNTTAAASKINISVLPSAPTVQFSLTQQFSASGGEPPYTYSVSSCPGSIDAQSGLFQAGTTDGTCTVIATDSTGAISIDDAFVTVTSTASLPVTATWTDTSSGCYPSVLLPICTATPPSSTTICETAYPSFTPGGSCAGAVGTYCISTTGAGQVGSEVQAYEIYSCQ